MGVRGGLADGQWALIQPLLPDRTPQRGGRWTDHRQVIDAVAFKYRSNLAWRDLPTEWPPWQTVFDRFTRWARDGTWHRILTSLQARTDAAGDLDWLVGVDSTIVRAHQHAAGARKGAPSGEPADHALGRSRGGLTTKVHLAADGRCRPLGFVGTAGQHGDAPQFASVLATIRVPRVASRPRVRPDTVPADRVYSSKTIRAAQAAVLRTCRRPGFGPRAMAAPGVSDEGRPSRGTPARESPGGRGGDVPPAGP
ncbi:IS5 family transposase [Yinghuangia aomiensis]